MSYGRHIDKMHTYSILDSSNKPAALERCDRIKDQGVWFDEKLFFREHQKINTAYVLLGLIKQNFKYLTLSI